MRSRTNVLTESVESAKFELKLPEAFLEKPKWVIGVSPSREVHIYEKQSLKTLDASTQPKVVYKTYLVGKKSGKEVQGTNNWYRAQEYTDLVDLKFALLSVSAQLNVRKRVRKDEQMESDDDE